LGPFLGLRGPPARYKHQALKAELDKRKKETDEEEELLFQLEQVPSLESAGGNVSDAMEQARKASMQGGPKRIVSKEKNNPEIDEYTKLLQDVVEYAMQMHI
jgi:hypothetical protein